MFILRYEDIFPRFIHLNSFGATFNADKIPRATLENVIHLFQRSYPAMTVVIHYSQGSSGVIL